MGNASNEQQKRKDRVKCLKIQKHKWTAREDKALIAALFELCETGWLGDTGIFKSGYTSILERQLKSKLSGCNLKASPHIESRLKTLKRQCHAITDIKSAIGIEWDNEKHMVVCEDDGVWEDWIKDHSDARPLRNKAFPLYDDLHIIFERNKANQKCIENASRADKAPDGEKNNIGDSVVRAEGFGANTVDNFIKMASAKKDLDSEEANDDDTLMGYDDTNRKIKDNVMGVDCIEPHHEEVNDHAENVLRADGLNAVLLEDVVGGTQKLLPSGSGLTEIADKRQSCSNCSCSYGLGDAAKILQTFLDKYEQQFSILVQLLGRDATADKAAAAKIAKLNGKLKKIPNLSLHARLRAASLIVSDRPKLDLFYSLPDDDRKEWVSMLLSGLI